MNKPQGKTWYDAPMVAVDQIELTNDYAGAPIRHPKPVAEHCFARKCPTCKNCKCKCTCQQKEAA